MTNHTYTWFLPPGSSILGLWPSGRNINLMSNHTDNTANNCSVTSGGLEVDNLQILREHQLLCYYVYGNNHGWQPAALLSSFTCSAVCAEKAKREIEKSLDEIQDGEMLSHTILFGFKPDVNVSGNQFRFYLFYLFIFHLEGCWFMHSVYFNDI